MLACYQLAKFYHQPPEHFLNLPLAELRMHVRRTNQIVELARPDGD